ncbi:unnamed protein product [Notodromas monacha]|uniref:Uncharacterized protein n=1 Tax=Notodromas monacha TaxID=399045 RepID=A0A7R9G9H7_9CRUS|nr:unnamed protein product [Notodromas monacha]CAG0912906.1 unnamed protein product [Notodromas monacha]
MPQRFLMPCLGKFIYTVGNGRALKCNVPPVDEDAANELAALSLSDEERRERLLLDDGPLGVVSLPSSAATTPVGIVQEPPSPAARVLPPFGFGGPGPIPQRQDSTGSGNDVAAVPGAAAGAHEFRHHIHVSSGHAAAREREPPPPPPHRMRPRSGSPGDGEPQPIVFMPDDESSPEPPARRHQTRRMESREPGMPYEAARPSASQLIFSQGMALDQFRLISVLGRGHFGKMKSRKREETPLLRNL